MLLVAAAIGRDGPIEAQISCRLHSVTHSALKIVVLVVFTRFDGFWALLVLHRGDDFKVSLLLLSDKGAVLAVKHEGDGYYVDRHVDCCHEKSIDEGLVGAAVLVPEIVCISQQVLYVEAQIAKEADEKEGELQKDITNLELTQSLHLAKRQEQE